MSEDKVSIVVALVILLMMFAFVPCLELTALCCRKIKRSFSFGRNRNDGSGRSSLRAPSESPMTNNGKKSRDSDAA
jgi:hypothetical protein